MKKALRIGYNRYYCEENFKEHIAFVEKNVKTIDEVTLFAEFCHYGYWDEAFTRENAAVLQDRIKQYRRIGIKSVGINVLCTRGHAKDGWEVLPKTELQHEVNGQGEELNWCLCIANEKFTEYIVKRYAVYAATGADFIWSDDDLRLDNGGLGCMCDSCIRKFNETYGLGVERDTLTEKIHEDSVLRKRWMDLKNEQLKMLYETIAKTVRGVNPDIKIGYMSIADTTDLAEASQAVKGRPGGGFYDERTPLAVFSKCMSVQEQVLGYPERIKDIQYEYEAFNYQSLDRSLHFSELETSLALMSGCNGVLYNNDIFYDRQPFLDMLEKSARKWDVLTRQNETLKPAGVYCPGPENRRILLEVGIPVSLDLDSAAACFVTGEAWNGFAADKIEKIIEKGVMTDGRGLEILCEKGYSAICGGKVKKAYASGMAERFSDHELCGKYKNHYRDAFMNFSYYIGNRGYAYALAPSEKAQTVSNLEMITHRKLGCSLYVYENEKGARIAVDGYLFMNSAKTYGKKEQLGNVLDWISDGKIPVRIKETIKVMPTVRADENGNMTLMLTNASFDETGSFEMEARSNKQFYVICQDGTLVPAKQERKEKNTKITIDTIRGWNYLLLTTIP